MSILRRFSNNIVYSIYPPDSKAYEAFIKQQIIIEKELRQLPPVQTYNPPNDTRIENPADVYSILPKTINPILSDYFKVKREYESILRRKSLEGTSLKNSILQYFDFLEKKRDRQITEAMKSVGFAPEQIKHELEKVKTNASLIESIEEQNNIADAISQQIGLNFQQPDSVALTPQTKAEKILGNGSDKKSDSLEDKQNAVENIIPQVDIAIQESAIPRRSARVGYRKDKNSSKEKP